MAVAAKLEVEIWQQPQNQLFDPDFLFTPSDSFFARTYRFATIQNVTDRRQTDRRQCTKGSTNSTVGQKLWDGMGGKIKNGKGKGRCGFQYNGVDQKAIAV